VLRLAQTVFEMPHAGNTVGSVDWVAENVRKPQNITYSDAAKYPQLLSSLVRYLIKRGDKRGFPRFRPGEEVPEHQAYLHKTSKRPKVCHKPHKQLPFLCVSSVNKAIRDLKNLGLYPVRVQAENMPNNKNWDNFARVLHTFYVLYCNYQGLVSTSARARQVHLYVFYANFDGPRGRKWPVIRAIHRMVTNGRHRFAATSTKHFWEFFKFLDTNPHLLDKLNDKGVGGVPAAYTAFVENGMRSHGDDLHAMGTNAMRSGEDWKNVPRWMKREAYIAAVRTKWGRGNYWQWDHFSWQDYIEREDLALTFYKRHLPLSDGKQHWDERLVRNPLSWGTTTPKKTTKKKRSRTSRSLSAPSKAEASSASSPDVMIYDPELGKLVPVSDEDEGWVSEA